jgi:hypothetical protein
MLRRVWRYQKGNQNPLIEEGHTTQWPKEKGQKEKHRSTKHTHKTKVRVTRTALKTGGELMRYIREEKWIRFLLMHVLHFHVISIVFVIHNIFTFSLLLWKENWNSDGLQFIQCLENEQLLLTSICCTQKYHGKS